MRHILSLLLLLSAVGADNALAQVTPQGSQGHEVLRGPTVSTARSFAERLMREYAPPNADSILGLGVFLRRHPHLLDPSLLRAIVADTLRQARTAEQVSLDFDPFLGGQDRCPRIDVGPATGGRNRFRVEIHQVCGEASADTADAIWVLHVSGGSFAISNILYPREHTDLRKVLAELAE